MQYEQQATNHLLILLIAPLFFGCSEPVKEENKNSASASSVSPGEKYSIDTKQSVVTWKGFVLMSSITGIVYYQKGELMIENGQLVGGTVTINMNTIEDLAERANHLKSAVFFDVKKLPISTFAITNVATMNRDNIKITGDLTIKGVRNAVTFPVKMEFKDGIIQPNGKVIIDRTQWGIRCYARKFDNTVGDRAISDDIEFVMKIVAKK